MSEFDPISICLNCNFPLVLLIHRRKFKCAKCSRLFSQKEIDETEFRKYNLKERSIDKKEYLKESRIIYNQLKEEWKIKKEERVKNYIIKSRENQRKYREENPEKYNEEKREYWAKHKNHFNEKRRERYELRKPIILKQQTVYRQNNKTIERIKELRNQQKRLTLLFIKSGLLSLSLIKIQDSLPTFLLA